MKQLNEMTLAEFEHVPLRQRAEYIAATDHRAEADAARYWLQRWEGRYDTREAADFWLDSRASDFPWTERTYNRIITHR